MLRGCAPIASPQGAKSKDMSALRQLRWPSASPMRLCSAPRQWLQQQLSSQTTRATTTAARKADTTAVAVLDQNIEDKEMHKEASESYLAYAMSVIVGRALPDVRDGLKPVHRRILYAMHELGLLHTRPHRKCARVVGEVLGKFHPHGDGAVYDALVRLAQDFSMREPLIAGHGNFGSIDDDPAAAMRYTECRLRALTSEALLADLEADTVDFVPTFDASQNEPVVLPAKVPHLLVNGSAGIAVGIATKIPPHNLREVVAGLRALVEQPGISTRELMQHIPAPDFPTGGELITDASLLEMYETGNGSVTIRAKVTIEGEGGSRGSRGGKGSKAKKPTADAPSGGKSLLVITELPYQVTKSDLVAKVAELAEAKVLEGVADVRDESDRDGIRVVVEVRRGVSPEVVLAQLLKHTRLQQRFSGNMVALVGGTPRTLGLKDCLQHFLEFRCEVVQRRAQHQLARAQARQHLVEGYLLALQQLEPLVETIKAAKDGPSARKALVDGFGLSSEQAEAVLNLTLRRLTGMEKAKLSQEAAQLGQDISGLQSLLASREEVLALVLQEAQQVADRHGGDRRSLLVQDSGTIDEVSLVPNARGFLIFSARGDIKRVREETFEAQRRGGKGKAAARLRENDALEQVVPVMAHDHVLFVTARGRAYSTRAYKLPEASRASAGTAMAQVLGLQAGDSVAALLPVSDFSTIHQHLVLVTQQGITKKTGLEQFSKISNAGLAAINVSDNDALAWALRCPGGSAILMASSDGQVLVFRGDDASLRATGRTAAGVQTMRLKPGAQIVSVELLPPHVAQLLPGTRAAAAEAEPESEVESELGAASSNGTGHSGSSAADAAASSSSDEEVDGSSTAAASGPWVLFVTENGMGKRVPVSEFRLSGRRGVGIKGLKLKAGDRLVAAHLVREEDEMVLASRAGLMTRCKAASVRGCSRGAVGVALMKLAQGDVVSTVAVVRAGQ